MDSQKINTMIPLGTPPPLNVVLRVILLGLCVVFCFGILWFRFFCVGFVVHAFVW